jgi:general secretion pathway protein D
VNKQFADDTIHVPLEVTPPSPGQGVASPILPLPGWTPENGAAPRMSNDLPPEGPATTTVTTNVQQAPRPRMTSAPVEAAPAAVPVDESAPTARTAKQKANERTKMLKK